jgi:hypothetical protein
MGYFAGRAAPLGPVSAGVVTATFYNFAPPMVRRAIPDAWDYSTPSRIIQARLAGVDLVLSRLVGSTTLSDGLKEAASLAEDAVRAADPGGRPLFAGNAELEPPADPHLKLWWAATCLREHRGDGHVATLTHAGIDGCEAHVLMAATGAVPRATLQDNRGWTDDKWAAAQDRLQARGLLASDGGLTASGRTIRQQIEDDTDRLAGRPLKQLGAERAEKLAALLDPVARLIHDGGVIPTPNPIGVPRQ